MGREKVAGEKQQGTCFWEGYRQLHVSGDELLKISLSTPCQFACLNPITFHSCFGEHDGRLRALLRVMTGGQLFPIGI